MWFVETTKSCIHPFAYGFVPFPLSVEEVVHWIMVIPLSEEVIVVLWRCALSLKCEVDSYFLAKCLSL